jgi:hypothetical protein
MENDSSSQRGAYLLSGKPCSPKQAGMGVGWQVRFNANSASASRSKVSSGGGYSTGRELAAFFLPNEAQLAD